MLVNGACKHPNGQPNVLDDKEILDMYTEVLSDEKRLGERCDIIIMWCMTALSKLSIRIGQTSAANPENSQSAIIERIKSLIVKYSQHPNIEIQQRSCEFQVLLQTVWDGERNSIFEPMPFKGDENMLDDSAKNRAAMDDDEGEGDLLFGIDTDK